ncbi:outer membrane protein transport protein [Antarctobacter sp.]|uniref:outer membrane protein transport protein n=1 Tax=Antarctobacter sp. TaxID=1872577 RepID=UPI003A9577F9
MKNMLVGASVLALTTGSAFAAGLDRSGQSASAIFAEDGSTALTFGLVTPSVTGTDAGGSSYDVAKRYSQTGLSFTKSVNARFNWAFIADKPYGVDVDYNADPLTSALGGTKADLNSNAMTIVGRYKITDRISVFAGIGAQSIDADVSLNGQAYAGAIATAGVARTVPGLDPATLGAALRGDAAAATLIDTTYGAGTTAALGGAVAGAVGGFNATGGYTFRMKESTSPNYLIGAAYEIPDIALRIAGTYRFETKHTATISEGLLGTTFDGTTPGYDDEIDYVSPQSFNLEFQTGIAAGTLLTASYRWTEFSAVDIIPTRLGSDLVNLDDAHRFTLGVAKRFNDRFAGSVTLSYEPPTGNRTVSPLGPTDGLKGISFGGQFTEGPVKISGGINYSWLGDADAGVAGIKAAEFRDNHAVGIGFKAEVTF